MAGPQGAPNQGHLDEGHEAPFLSVILILILHHGEEGEGWLSSLISLRADILNCDYRSLYLAWLFCVQMGEMEDEEPEPPVPPNLTELNAPLQSFVDFMRIDTDLVAVAAENSTPEDQQTDPEALKTWIHNLPASEKISCFD